jgi:hypothetical protein
MTSASHRVPPCAGGNTFDPIALRRNDDAPRSDANDPRVTRHAQRCGDR